jgi:hypothetical protein
MVWFRLEIRSSTRLGSGGVSLPLKLAINFPLAARDGLSARARDFATDLAKAQ